MTRFLRAGLPVLFALMSTVAPAQKVVQSELISYDTLRDATFGDDLTHEFSQEPGAVRVTVRCKLKHGEFSWRVENADGKELWRRNIHGKTKVDLQEQFPGQAGTWRIVIDYKDARGKYYIKMEAVE